MDACDIFDVSSMDEGLDLTLEIYAGYGRILRGVSPHGYLGRKHNVRRFTGSLLVKIEY